jgi:hypothetical protein
MVQIVCDCGASASVTESQIGLAILCEKCGKKTSLIAAEQLPEGAGGGDFDTMLVVRAGPQEIGTQLLLGGVPDITIGKLPDKQIVLPGKMVSRFHCKLVRLDFGPSRWQIEDNNSTNGVFVNNERVQTQELKPGDNIVIGDYEFEFLEQVNPVAHAATSANVQVVQNASNVLMVPALARKLSYATPQPSHHQRQLLGDCDIDWVMRLRNASTLMVWTIIVNFFSIFLPRMLDPAVVLVTSLMSFAAVWLLTSAEPQAPESQSWISLRLTLRVFGTITVIGELLAVAAGFVGNMRLILVGAFLAFMIVPQTGLFLFYLRRLALRLPNYALAVNIVIVMIGLPALLAMTVGGAFFAATFRSPVMLMLTGLGGIIGLVIFRIWYLILLIWFNKSFS